ncbi:MAG: YceD family protein [Actinomycetota bacterium]
MVLPGIEVHDLLGSPGASRRHDVLGTIDGLATELAAVPDDAPLGGSLLLESVVEGILVSGPITGTWTVRCARCLTERSQAFSVEVSELFAAAVPDDNELDEDDDDYVLVDETIDLEQLVRDAVGVEMPFAPLCRPDCQGLCEVCGENRNLGECPGHEAIDPRFAVLADLLPDLPDID